MAGAPHPRRFLLTIRRLAITIAVAWLVALPLAPRLLGVASASSGTFTLAGTDPYVASQSTTTGQAITTLFPWNNQLYPGYGDYNANTGPIQIAPFDPTTNTFSPSLLSATTEAIYNYRSIGGNLYAPAIDPQGSLSNYAYAEGQPWVNAVNSGLAGEHIFDVVTLTGSDLWAVGSTYSNNTATAWRSTDGGQTWTVMLSVPPLSSTDDARFYFAGVYNGKLYLQANDYYCNCAHPTSNVFDGTSWSTGPNLFSTYDGEGWRPIVFAGKLVYRSWAEPYWSYLMSFDGRSDHTITTWQIYDFTVDGSYLYVLTTSGQIYRTTDLSSWSLFATGPSNSQSLAILNGILYLGTANSGIYRYSQPVSGSVTPTATATAAVAATSTATSVPVATTPTPTAPAQLTSTPSPSPYPTLTPIPSATPTRAALPTSTPTGGKSHGGKKT